jgi:hypothetical protein
MSPETLLRRVSPGAKEYSVTNMEKWHVAFVNEAVFSLS